MLRVCHKWALIPTLINCCLIYLTCHILLHVIIVVVLAIVLFKYVLFFGVCFDFVFFFTIIIYMAYISRLRSLEGRVYLVYNYFLTYDN